VEKSHKAKSSKAEEEVTANFRVCDFWQEIEKRKIKREVKCDVLFVVICIVSY
jgi:hypothetical protein